MRGCYRYWMLDGGYWIKKQMFMSYKKLQIWVLAREVVIEVHEMTLKLPKFELFEEGSQIRRSSKTTKASIVEGYGRRKYKQDWIKFIIYALSSNDETMDHLENLWDTKSLTEEQVYITLKNKIDILGKMLNRFLKAVEEEHQSPK
jgi:four helix bundle protein